MTEGRIGLQFSVGGEFGRNPEIDAYARKVLGLLPNIESYKPLAIVTSLNPKESSGVVTKLVIKTGKDEEREAVVLSDLRSFQEYCQNKENRIRGMVLLVPSIDHGGISPQALESLKSFFARIGKVSNPNLYRVWFVDQDAVNLLSSPKDEESKKRIERKKEVIKEIGLCSPEYRHPGEIGFFFTRPMKRRKTQERDVSQDERINFLEQWAEMIAEFRGARIISTQGLRERLSHSHSYLKSMEEAGDLDGVVLEESCGCRVELHGRSESTILSCDQENCVQKSKVKTKEPFELRKVYPFTHCGECGGERTREALWADKGGFNPQKGIRVDFKVTCLLGYGSHSYEDSTWVDPARIINPLYIYYSEKKQKK